MSEPRILGPTGRATIRQQWTPDDPGRISRQAADVLALLDTCDAMESVIRHRERGHIRLRGEVWMDPEGNQLGPVTPAEAAVLDTIREDPT